MKRMMVVFSMLAAALFAQDEGMVKVTGDRVSLRAAPDLTAVLLERAMRGDVLQLKDNSQPEWVGVVPPETVDLWVNREFIVDNMVVPEKLNVRSGPSMNHDSVGILKQGQSVVVRGVIDDWLRIAPPEESTLWISRRYVTVSIPLSAVPVEPAAAMVEVEAPAEEIIIAKTETPAPVVVAPVTAAPVAVAPVVAPAPVVTTVAVAPAPAATVAKADCPVAECPVAADCPVKAECTLEKPCPVTGTECAEVKASATTAAATTVTYTYVEPVIVDEGYAGGATASRTVTTTVVRPADPVDPTVYEIIASLEQKLPARLRADATKEQGVSGTFSGILLPESDLLYKLVQPGYGQTVKLVCYVRGNMAQLKTYAELPVMISGKQYWAEGVLRPVIVPARIQILNKLLEKSKALEPEKN